MSGSPAAVGTRRPLRILHVVAYPFLTRGTPIQAFLLAREQQRRGHRVTCAFASAGATDDGGRSLQPVIDAGIDLHLFAMDRFRELPRFRRLLSGGGFDVIHAHYRDVALRFSLLGSVALHSAALVASWGNVYPIDRRRWLPARDGKGKARASHSAWAGIALRARRVARVVAVAEAVKDVLVQTGSVRPEKIAVVYEGVDPDIFHPSVPASIVRNQLGLPPGAPVVGIASAYYWVKDYPTFLRAAEQLVSVRPDARFLIVGDGTERIARSLLAAHGLAGRVAVAGARADMPAAIAAMDVLVSCSRFEALSGVAREALAMAKPVVCTDVGGNAELIRAGETGWLVPPGDPQALANALSAVLADAVRAAAIGEAGRRLVLARHTLDRRAAAIDELYGDVLDTVAR